jgi:hypothetical protein
MGVFAGLGSPDPRHRGAGKKKKKKKKKKKQVERRSAVKRSVNKNLASKVKRYIHALECTVSPPVLFATSNST